MTSATWSDLVNARGDSWLLTTDINTAFNEFQSLNHLFVHNSDIEGEQKIYPKRVCPNIPI